MQPPKGAVKNLPESKIPMKRKPDLLWVLVIIFSLGVVTTGYTQSLRDRNAAQALPSHYESQTMLAPHTTADR